MCKLKLAGYSGNHFSMGRKVVVSPPVKIFNRKWMKCKSKFGRRFQKVRLHVGWCETIPDGEVIVGEFSIHCNQSTFNKLIEVEL